MATIGTYGNPAISSYVIDADGYFVATNVEAALAEIYERFSDADNVYLDQLGTPTYRSVQDWVDVTQCAGRFAGGIITATAPADGTIAVSAGSGFIKTIDDGIGETLFFDWEAQADIALTNNDTNYIFVDYNIATGAVTIQVETNRANIDHRTEFTLGRVWRDGNITHIVNSGTNLQEHEVANHERLIAVRGFEHAEGATIAEVGTRELSATEGIFYLGSNRIVTPVINTTPAGGDTFTYWYRDGVGGWTRTLGNTQIDNQNYDANNAAGPQALTANRYGVFWVYMDLDGHIVVLYGQGDYTLAQAEDANPPATIPEFLSEFCMLAAKIWIQKAAVAFTDIASAYITYFPTTNPANHNDLGALQGGQVGEYYHLTAAEHTELNAWLPNVTLGADGSAVFGGDVTVPNLITAGLVDGVDISAISLSNMPAAATGNIDAGGQAITNVGNVDGVDVSALNTAYGAHRHDLQTLQLDGINSDGGAFAFTTTGAITFNQQLIMTHAVAGMLDLNPANTGSQSVINVTPSASLAAGSGWYGLRMDIGALDPATGAISYIYGAMVDARTLVSVDKNASVSGFAFFPTVTETSTGFYHALQEMTQNKYQNAFVSYGVPVLSATATYRGLLITWSGITRDAGAPVLEGVKVELPADYTGFGTCYAAYFSGDGRSVEICDSSYALDVSGAARIAGDLTVPGGSLTVENNLYVGAGADQVKMDCDGDSFYIRYGGGVVGLDIDVNGDVVIGGDLTVSGGNIGIGMAFDVGYIIESSDADLYSRLGRTLIGSPSFNDYMALSHRDMTGAGQYALLQNSVGETYLNAATDKPINFRINNATIASFTNTGELDITGVGACIDLNPAATGSQSVIHLAPSAALAAGSDWKGINLSLSSLDPATGAACTVFGIEIYAGGVVSVDNNTMVVGLYYVGTISDLDYGIYVVPIEKVANVTHASFLSYMGNLVLSHTATYRGFWVDWDGVTRDAEAPVLEGLRVQLPANYTDFGTSFAGLFTGDGRTVYICDTTYALNVSGTMQLNGVITAIDSITLDLGATINEFSIDGTLVGNSDTALPTEQAVKTYVDGAIAGVNSLAEILAIGNTSDGTDMILDEGSDLIVYSGDEVIEVARIDGATGNILLSVINADASNPLRDSPTIELKGKYWTGAATADVAMLLGTDVTGGVPRYKFFVKREDLTNVFSVDESGHGMVLGDFTAANIVTAGTVDGVDVSSIVAFATITGITNNVVADGIADTLTLGSANNLLTIVGTAATDTIEWTVVEANFILDGNTVQIDGINSNGGPFSFTTAGVVQFNNALSGITNLTMVSELDMTGAFACIDLNPAGTGTKDIVSITPSAALVAGSIWTGISQSLGALDPATGALTIIKGFEVVANFLASVDGNLRFDAFVSNACPADDTQIFRANMTELTADKVQVGFLFDGGAKNLSATGTYQGLYIDWGANTRDGGAPVLQGVRSQLPGDYTNFGASYAGYFSGDGRSVTICDTTYALNVSGAMNLAGSVIGVTSLAMGGALSGVTTLAMGGTLSGVTSLTLSGSISGGTTFSCGGANFDIDAGGNIVDCGSIAMGGALSGVTTLAMGGALSGVTSISMNSTLGTVTNLTITGTIATPTTITTSSNITCGGDVRINGNDIRDSGNNIGVHFLGNGLGTYIYSDAPNARYVSIIASGTTSPRVHSSTGGIRFSAWITPETTGKTVDIGNTTYMWDSVVADDFNNVACEPRWKNFTDPLETIRQICSYTPEENDEYDEYHLKSVSLPDWVRPRAKAFYYPYDFPKVKKRGKLITDLKVRDEVGGVWLDQGREYILKKDKGRIDHLSGKPVKTARYRSDRIGPTTYNDEDFEREPEGVSINKLLYLAVQSIQQLDNKLVNMEKRLLLLEDGS